MGNGKQISVESNKILISALGIDESKVGVIENDKLGHESMKYFGFPMASPRADEETKKVALDNGGIVINDYSKGTIDTLFRKF